MIKGILNLLVFLILVFNILSIDTDISIGYIPNNDHDSITLTIPYQRYLALPNDTITIPLKVTISNSEDLSNFRQFFDSQSIYFSSNNNYSWIVMNNNQKDQFINFVINIPPTTALGNHLITLGIESNSNIRLGMQTTITIINSSNLVELIPFRVIDNLDKPRPIELTPSILNIGISENIQFQTISGKDLVLPLLIGESYEFKVKDLRSSWIKYYSDIAINTSTNEIELFIDLFDVTVKKEQDRSINQISHTIDNRLDSNIPITINYYSGSEDLLSSLTLPIFFGKSKLAFSIPEIDKIKKIEYSSQDRVIESIILDNTSETFDNFFLEDIYVLGAITIFAGVFILRKKKYSNDNSLQSDIGNDTEQTQEKLIQEEN